MESFRGKAQRLANSMVALCSGICAVRCSKAVEENFLEVPGRAYVSMFISLKAVFLLFDSMNCYGGIDVILCMLIIS